MSASAKGLRSASFSSRDGIEIFLDRYCPEPEKLRRVLNRVRRMVDTRDGAYLCEKGDAADEFWIVASGLYRIEQDGKFMGTRVPGELIGEQAFYRLPSDVVSPVRGASIQAIGNSSVLVIDCSAIERLSGDLRSLWHQTCARVLSEKLDQALAARVQHLGAEDMYNATSRRFVSEEGMRAARAAYAEGNFNRLIDTEQCDSVIWFSDIQGFSHYAGGRPANAVSKFVRDIMDIQAASIARHQGQIDKFMGDGLMAFWKAPDTRRLRECCERAVTAARECILAVQRFLEATQIPCDVRVGLHTGSVMFGDFGGGERIAFTAIGEVVNTASRYEQARVCREKRELGRLRIGESMFALLENPHTIRLFEDTPRTIIDKGGMQHLARVANL